MIDATLTMLRARRDEQVAYLGVVAALFCDDLPAAVVRLEAVRDAARDCEKACGRRDPRKRSIYRNTAATANDLLPGMRQLIECDGQRP
jgi:hypothetical protein